MKRILIGVVMVVLWCSFITSPAEAQNTTCTKKQNGDANCDEKLDLVDYEQWRREYLGILTTYTADFDTNSTTKPDLIDYEIWRRSFTGSPSITETITPAQTATPTPPIGGSNGICLTRNGPTITFTGNQNGRLDASIANGSNVDAGAAVWQSGAAGNYPVLFRTSSTNNQNICWNGGAILGDYPASTPWTTFHGTSAFLVHSPKMRVESVRIKNYGDGIGFGDGGSEWNIFGVKMSDIHDDCVENDYKYNGTIDDSLLEGCYVGFSSRGHSGQAVQIDGRNHTFTITNTLVWVKPLMSVYKGPAPGNGPIFKWSQDAATEGYGNKLVVKNIIIRVDQLPNHGNLGVPYYTDPQTGAKTPYITECANNTIVWLGAGAYPEPMPSCFTITKDKGVWDAAVAAWNTRHPELAQ